MGSVLTIGDLEGTPGRRLITATTNNEVVLFLGAGFSRGAKNHLSNPLPSGRELAADLWEFLEYGSKYDGTDLPTIFEAALNGPKGHAALRAFLEARLLCAEIPYWYDTVARVFWYRIYTTNVDDLVEQVFARSNRVAELKAIAATTEDFYERDQLLFAIQYVKLHGTLPASPKDITLSWRQYGRRLSEHDPWYDHFVRDYSTRMTVLIGTDLNEPWLWQYVAAREKRAPRQPEHRPDSFLISPQISPAKASGLGGMNVIPVQASGEDFLRWLQSHFSQLPTREGTLRVARPELSAALEQHVQNLPGADRRRIEEFYSSIQPVRIETPDPSHRNLYLLGSAPGWQDLAHNLDAPREITLKVLGEVRESYAKEEVPSPTAVLGSAGCGKSTIIRRVALNLSTEGYPVFFAEREPLPRAENAAKVIASFDRRLILVIDNADLLLRWCADLLRAVAERRPLLLLAARTNRYDRYVGELASLTPLIEIPVPHLTNSDIDSVINVLERHHVLGRLRNMSDAQRRWEFEQRAQKQILVAMREATEGKGFDEITENEFQELTPLETKILYLCAAIATAARSYLTLDQLVACSEESPSGALEIINRNLRDIVVKREEPHSLSLRHYVIAELMCEHKAPKSILRDAYIRLLAVLSHDLPRPANRASRVLTLYRRTINHEAICRRFEVADARLIYESLRDRFAHEAHFWLQFGSLELTQGDLQLARNYIAQAESLAPGDDYIRTAKGHLLLKAACVADGPGERAQLWAEGESLVLEQVERRGKVDPHAYHIFGTQVLDYAAVLQDTAARRETIEKGRAMVAEGRKNHPRSSELKKLEQELTSAYLSLAVH